jgi:hypothetical protein
MRNLVALLAVLVLFLSFVVPAESEVWVICWQRKLVKVTRGGERYYCKKCYSKRVDYGGDYFNRENCQIFNSLNEADSWWYQNCDCR